MYEEMQGTLNTSMKNEARWLNKCRLYARQILAHAGMTTHRSTDHRTQFPYILFNYIMS
jgi:hypothetical protein